MAALRFATPTDIVTGHSVVGCAMVAAQVVGFPVAAAVRTPRACHRHEGSAERVTATGTVGVAAGVSRAGVVAVATGGVPVGVPAVIVGEVVVVATSPGRPAVAGVGVGAKPVAKAVTPPCPIAQANAQAANAVCTIEDRFNLAWRVMAFVPRGDNAILGGPCGLARVAWAGHCVLNPSATLGRRWLKLMWHRGA
ncbi:MAG: hypothetical protein KGS10_16955 [Chloroflexi bacterium]|nr:hypothetical protein [Chloroflexota bacterium]